MIRYFEGGAVDFELELFHELATIRRNNFGSIYAFQARLNYLKLRLGTTPFKMSEEGYVWAAMRAFKFEYSELYWH